MHPRSEDPLDNLHLRSYIVSPREVPVSVLTRVVRIGNSQGVRIPRVLLEESHLSAQVELTAEPDQIVIRSARTPRAGWDEAFAAMAAAGDDALLDPEIPTEFDEMEWSWPER